MRKLLFLLFPALATLAILNCSADSNMPCLNCIEPYPSQQGGSQPYPSSPSQNQYAYCLIYDSYYGYECIFMSISSCYYEDGSTYSDNTCGGYWWQSVQQSSSSFYPSSSSQPSSSSFRPSSSSVEYTGGSCNASDYGNITIGSQVWMAKNWGCYVSGSKCYDNDQYNCNTYGRLYDWATAMALPSSCKYSPCADIITDKHRGICPTGWHIPSDDDWDILVTSVGSSSTAGSRLKARNGWNDDGNGTNNYNFAALPGGYGIPGGYFDGEGYDGYWWSASESNDYDAYYWNIVSYYDELFWSYDSKDYLRSVRCVKD